MNGLFLLEYYLSFGHRETTCLWIYTQGKEASADVVPGIAHQLICLSWPGNVQEIISKPNTLTKVVFL